MVVDVDECKEFGRCSQVCHNLPGSYKCTCNSGYTMEMSVPTRCRANPEEHGYEAALVFAHRNSLRRIGLHSSASDYGFLLNNTHSAVALDFHYEQNTYYFSDVKEEAIYKYTSSNPKPEMILNKGIRLPDGISFDWINLNLYWTDAADNTVSLYSLEHKVRKTLFTTNLDEPRAIIVDPRDQHRFLYWTDWGNEPKIEKAGLDGQYRETLVKDLVWPNGLTIGKPEIH